MLRVVVDPGVLVSGFIVGGPPGRILDHWRNGEFELVVSEALLAELEDVLSRPHLAARAAARDVHAYLTGLRLAAIMADDPPAEPGLTPDPRDDYLVTLARAAKSDLILSGDAHLTGLVSAEPPVMTPRAFVDLFDE